MSDSLFQKTQRVRIIIAPENIGVVTNILDPVDGEYWYEVFFGPQNIQNIPESSLELSGDASDPIGMLLEGRYAGIDGLIRTYTYSRLTGQLNDHLYTILSTRTQLYPHQFKPILKFLDSFKRRLLIADEVGLGKTIEAGYILLEQSARMKLQRCLVVCPASLRTKWKLELERRFSLDWPVLDLPDLREFLRKYREYGPETEFFGIASMQALRRVEFIEEWEATGPGMNLVIVDEAHHMRNTGTLTNKLGRILSDSAEAMIMLTATPVQIGNENLFNLLRILDPEEFDNLYLFEERLRANEPVVRAYFELTDDNRETRESVRKRLSSVMDGYAASRFESNPIYQSVMQRLSHDGGSRRDFLELKRDVSELNLLSHVFTRTKKSQALTICQREAQVVNCIFTAQEQEFYNAVTNYVIGVNAGRTATAFITMMPQRQIASCIQAAIEYWSEREMSFHGDLDSEESDLDIIDFETLDLADFSVAELNLGLKDLVRLGKELKGVDSKYSHFLEALRTMQEEEPGRKVIVFSYFKKTLSYLSKKLEKDGFTNLVINGDVQIKEREDRIDQFRDDPSILVLLSSEVGSEGIDLQFCDALVNYDLPWNPMVVEQRIGRLDRIGQKSPVINIVNLSVEGTIEEKILNRLYWRIHIFERSIGDLEAILGSLMSELARDLLSNKLTEEEQIERIEQKAEVLANRQEEFRILEEESVRLIGHDDYFSSEIKRLIDESRYVTPGEMRLYLAEFLRAKFPNSKLVKTDNKDIFEFKVDHDFESFVMNTMEGRNRTILLEFLTRAQGGSVRITFHGEVANEHPYVILMNHYHPVFQAITGYYGRNLEELSPVSKIEMGANGLSTGDYFYFLFEMKIFAARDSNRLEPILVKADTGEIIAGEDAEKWFADLVRSGSSYPGLPEVPKKDVQAAIQKAQTTMARIAKKRREQNEVWNKAMIINRMDSIEQSYNVRINKKKELLARGERQRKQETYLRMLRGHIRRLEAEKKEAIEKLEARKRIDISHKPISCGYVKII